jgi:hypothetical protein
MNVNSLNIPASAVAITKFASSILSPESAKHNRVPSALNIPIASYKVWLGNFIVFWERSLVEENVVPHFWCHLIGCDA